MKVTFKFWLFSAVVGPFLALPAFAATALATGILWCIPSYRLSALEIQRDANLMLADWASVVFLKRHYCQ